MPAWSVFTENSVVGLERGDPTGSSAVDLVGVIGVLFVEVEGIVVLVGEVEGNFGSLVWDCWWWLVGLGRTVLPLCTLGSG
jgi:hypothetical protein